MSTALLKIYVGNLSYDTTNESLKEYFSKVASVKDVNIVMDRDSGRSKGFGFITFEEGADKDAVLALDNQEYEGRKLRVNIAQDKNSGERRPRSDHGGGYGGGENRSRSSGYGNNDSSGGYKKRRFED